MGQPARYITTGGDLIFEGVMEEKDLEKKIAATLYEELFRLSPLIEEARQGILNNRSSIITDLTEMKMPYLANERCDRLRDYEKQYGELSERFSKVLEELKKYANFLPDDALDILGPTASSSDLFFHFYSRYFNN